MSIYQYPSPNCPGEIKNMTGLSAPYEEPEHPLLIIKTDKFTLNQCVDEVIEFLLKKGLIGKDATPTQSFFSRL